MAKVKQGLVLLLFLTVCWQATGQQGYRVFYRAVDADSSRLSAVLSLKTNFVNRSEALRYLDQLLPLLKEKGFFTASVDSLIADSTEASLLIFLGEKYLYQIKTRPEDEDLLKSIAWPGGSMDEASLSSLRRRILNRLEDQGYPFGKTYLENITISGNHLMAGLKIDRGPLYRIDSIRVVGNLKLKNEFLQRYLQLPVGSPYQSSKINQVAKRLAALGFVSQDRPADLSLLGTGAVLNLYLSQKKSSRINALVGFLPSTDIYLKRKMQLAVDANIHLQNALGQGETFSLLWQQLQKQSPRLNLAYDQPYVFNSGMGLQFVFDMFRQDTSFMNIHLRLGGSYQLAAEQKTAVFLQWRQTLVSGINTAAILRSRRLPQEVDLSSVDLGASYQINSTDYRFNPKKGWELELTTAAGTKKIRKNNLILELKDPADPAFRFATLYDTLKQNAYQLRVNGQVANYRPLGRQTVLKLAVSGGWFQSASYFRNELFRIGGFKLLRGFNDESQYVSQYLIGSAEFRYLIGLNSYFFVFADGGAGRHVLEEKQFHHYLGTGLGLSFETKAGIIQLAWALGKRNDTQLDWKQSKIHIGFAGFF